VWSVTATSVELGWPAKFFPANFPASRQSTFPTSFFPLSDSQFLVPRFLLLRSTLVAYEKTSDFSSWRSKRRPREEVTAFLRCRCHTLHAVQQSQLLLISKRKLGPSLTADFRNTSQSAGIRIIIPSNLAMIATLP
jgi:hypothetical protein